MRSRKSGPWREFSRPENSDGGPSLPRRYFRQRMNYEDFCHIASVCTEQIRPKCRRFFSPSNFMKFEKDESGIIAILPFYLYVMRTGDEFDFVFVDADKPNYIKYHEILVKLVKVGGLIGIALKRPSRYRSGMRVLDFIFSTALDGKIKAWLYDCLGSRVDYDAPGLWCTTMAYIDFPNFATLDSHAEIVEALHEDVVDHLLTASSYLPRRCFAEVVGSFHDTVDELVEKGSDTRYTVIGRGMLGLEDRAWLACRTSTRNKRAWASERTNVMRIRGRQHCCVSRGTSYDCWSEKTRTESIEDLGEHTTRMIKG
ncbi:hypothetical protein Scep_002325 [Stephania cephalantha]|uniref:Uncharacterized protein n=1 Tax=Stephania cephalantha TaxID=152367 RepID=A0AAP0LDM8_9MAGN